MVFKEGEIEDRLVRKSFSDNPENAAKRKKPLPEDKPFREVDLLHKTYETPLSYLERNPAKRGYYSVLTKDEVSTDRRSRKTDRRKQKKKKR